MVVLISTIASLCNLVCLRMSPRGLSWSDASYSFFSYSTRREAAYRRFLSSDSWDNDDGLYGQQDFPVSPLQVSQKFVVCPMQQLLDRQETCLGGQTRYGLLSVVTVVSNNILSERNRPTRKCAQTVWRTGVPLPAAGFHLLARILNFGMFQETKFQAESVLKVGGHSRSYSKTGIKEWKSAVKNTVFAFSSPYDILRIPPVPFVSKCWGYVVPSIWTLVQAFEQQWSHDLQALLEICLSFF